MKEGVALCRACGKISRLGDIADQPVVDANALATPPAGGSCEETYAGDRVDLESLRSPGAAVVTLAVCILWNGIVSVFVLIAIAGLYTHFMGPLPKWFPMPTSSGKNGNLGPNMPLSETLFLCVFLIPFVVVGFVMVLAFFTCLMGRVEVVVTASEGRVRTGFGPFNWTRRFDASRVTRVAAGQTRYEQNGRFKPLIQIEADRTVKFGSMLPDERRTWMISVLHVALVTKTKGGRTTLGRLPFGRG